MKIFNNLEEMKPYYNEKTNTYEFIENGNLIDIVIDFELDINSNIRAGDIQARDIKARDIKALDIKAWNINARNIKALDIKAIDINASEDIEAIDIKARNINARNIKSCDIKAIDINASEDIEPMDIKARNIKANNISFYSVCFASETFVCNTIRGIRENSKYFCLDSEIVIKGDKKNVK